MRKITVALSGGHLTPSLAVISLIRSEHPDWDIIYFGRSHNFSSSHEISEEKRIIDKLGIKFFEIKSGRFNRNNVLANILTLFNTLVGIIESIKIFSKIKPDIMIFFGSYVGFPAAITALITKIPVVIHEQSVIPGFANKIISRYADVVCISFEVSRKYFKSKEIILTGNLVRPEVIKAHKILKERSQIPVLYIMGGTTGAIRINKAIYKILNRLIKKYMIFHQTGRDNYQQARRIRLSLRGDKRKFYNPIPYADTNEHISYMNQSDVIISRAGANSIYEIGLFKKPSLLVPLSHSPNNEQYHNAEFLANKGAALILSDDRNLSEEIISNLDKVIVNKKTFEDNITNLQNDLPVQGTNMIISIMENIIYAE